MRDFLVLLLATAALSAHTLEFPSFTGIFGVLLHRSFLRHNISISLITDIKFSVDRGFKDFPVVKTDTKEFYHATNLANFAEANEHCSQSGYESLVYIETEIDVAAMIKLLDGVQVSKLWVGGSIDGNEWCDKYQLFNESCWIWGDNKDHRISPKFWHARVHKDGRKQSPEDQVVYLVESNNLDFEPNTRLNQFVCQRRTGQAPPVQISTAPAKRFYYSSNAATFQEAREHCASYGYSSLALVETEEDLKEIKRLLNGAMVSSLWVGGGPTIKIHSSCRKMIRFNHLCWAWGDNKDKQININLWYRGVFQITQSAVDRTVFQPVLQKLFFQPDTNLNQFICERPYK